MASETGHFKCQHPRIIPHFERILSDLIWLVVEPPAHLKNIDQVSWDDEIPNIWKVIKAMFQTSNQHKYAQMGSMGYFVNELTI
jgi:hypothetical protein